MITIANQRTIGREVLDIKLAHSGSSLRRQLAKEIIKIEQSMHTNCPKRDKDLCQRVDVVYRIQCNKSNKFYMGSTTRPLHIRNKENLNTRISSFKKH